MQQSFIIGGFLFPSHEDAAVSVKPRRDTLDHPTPGALAPHALFGLLLAPRADVRHVAVTAELLANRVAIVALVEAQMSSTPRSRRARNRNAEERRGKKLLVVCIGAADRQTDRHAAAVGENRPFDAQLTAIGGVFAGFFPRPAAPWSS